MTLNDLVDCVYLINLEKSKDRLDSFKEQSLKHNIKFNRVIPVDSSLFSVNPTSDNGWNNNAKSLKETTKKIIQEAKKNKFKNILIFEDDAKIDSDKYTHFLADLRNFLSLVGLFDFIHIFHSHGVEFSLENIYNFRLTKDGVFGCVAYIVNESVYDLYIENLDKYEVPIDHITKRIHFYRRKSFLYMNEVIYHEKNNWSTLREKIVDY